MLTFLEETASHDNGSTFKFVRNFFLIPPYAVFLWCYSCVGAKLKCFIQYKIMVESEIV